MRILLIRHGDPDYVNDTLTEKGRREAALLAKRAVSMNMGECYKSPLGRAKDTAAPCLEVTGKTAEILDWLQEFPAQVDLNKNPELEKAYPDVKKEEGISYLELHGIWFRGIGQNMKLIWIKYMERNRSGEKFRSRRSIRSCD